MTTVYDWESKIALGVFAAFVALALAGYAAADPPVPEEDGSGSGCSTCTKVEYSLEALVCTDCTSIVASRP